MHKTQYFIGSMHINVPSVHSLEKIAGETISQLVFYESLKWTGLFISSLVRKCQIFFQIQSSPT